MKKLTLLSLIAAMSIGVVGCDDDGPPPPGDGPVGAAEFDIRCHIKGLGDLSVPVNADVEMSAPLEAGVPVDASIDTSSTIDETTAALILNFGTDPLSFDSMDVTIGVAGADVTDVDLTNSATPFDISFCSDCMATPPVPQENVLAVDTTVSTVTPDGAATLDFEVTSLDVTLGQVPLLGSLNILVPATQVRCTEATEDTDCCTSLDPMVCPVPELCWGADDAMGLTGWCSNDQGGDIEVFCEMPGDGSETISFPSPTPAAP